jgi:hypothetical protein
MTHKLIKTDNYILVVDDSVHPYDSSKVGNPLAHLPLNGSPIIEGVDLLPPIEDDVDKLATNYVTEDGKYGLADDADRELLSFKEGYNKAREKYKYTKEDVIRIVEKSRETGLTAEYLMLSSQYPTEFKCEVEVKCTGNNDKECFMHSPAINCGCVKPKTVTTAQGIQWVGKYK